MANSNKIIVDPKICHGKPVIKGTRIMVANILSLIAGGYDIDRVVDYYPELTKNDVMDAIKYAISTVQEEEIILPWI